MRTRIGMMVLALVAATCTSAMAADWYMGWGHRQLITVDQTFVNGDGVHTNFPVLITAGNVRAELWQHAMTNGNDILFTAADGTTKLSHELERYDVATTQLCAWVRIPELAANSNTTFYVYYGRSGSVSQQDAGGVWSDYRAVWHLNDAASTRYDSTANDCDLTPYGGASYTADGKIGGACAFDGSSGYLKSTKQAVNGNGTISMWAWYPSYSGAWWALFDANYNNATLVRKDGTAALGVFVCTGGYTTNDATYFTGMEGSWIYVTLALDNGMARVYRNGAYRGAAPYTGTPSHTDVSLGAQAAGSMFWNGRIDEPRVSLSVHSADWIATEYYNQNAPAAFASAAAEEDISVPDAAWYSSWGYRQRLVVSHARVSGNGALTNFPALVTESNVQPGLWTNAKSDGSDVLFTAADGVTKIPHELEKYDTSTTQLCAWVKLPVLAGATNTAFYVYYGKANAADQQNAGDTWSDYRAVWHMKETSGTRYDSTANDADVAANGGVTYSASGMIDGATAFDGSSGYLNSAKKVMNGNGTISTWVKMPASLTINHVIFDTTWDTGVLIREWNGSANPNQLDLFVGGANLPDLTYFTGAQSSWVYITVTMADGTAALYKNGQYRLSGSYTGPLSHTGVSVGGGPSWYWNGSIDETRVSMTPHSADWIATEYNNQSSPGLFSDSFAEEEVAQGSVIVIR
jgi:hypothetical protein